MTDTAPTTAARRHALRAMLAVADGDQVALTTVMRDAATDPGGVYLLIRALAEAAAANAAELAPDDWAEQCRLMLLDTELDGGTGFPTWGPRS